MKFEKVFLNEYGFYELKQKPTIEDRKNEFENEYYQKSMASYSSNYSDEEVRMFNIANKRKEMIIEKQLPYIYKRNNGDISLLDVGCGEGFLLNYFKKKGWKVTGIDFSSYGIEHNNPEVYENLLQGDCDEILPKLIANGRKYNVINMDAFLDMSLNPTRVLENCRELLENNGVLIIKVANNYSKLQLHLLEKGKLKQEYWLDETGHPFYFSKDGLQKFVEANGYKMCDLYSESLIDLNLLNDITNYYEVSNVGKKCYEARIEMETFYDSISPELTLDLLRTYAKMGIGREIVGIFVKQ